MIEDKIDQILGNLVLEVNLVNNAFELGSISEQEHQEDIAGEFAEAKAKLVSLFKEWKNAE